MRYQTALQPVAPLGEASRAYTVASLRPSADRADSSGNPHASSDTPALDYGGRVRSVAEYHAEVEQARRTAHALRVIAGITFAAGWATVALAVVALALDALPWDEAENLFLVLGVGGIVSGLAIFATSWSLQINASRMEMDLATKEIPDVASGHPEQ